MSLETQTALLTTVNAPYQNCLDESGLAAALLEDKIALGQVSSFLTEIDAVEQKSFALEFGISVEKLTQVAQSFTNWSGQTAALVA
jgi:hypothetical protein